MVMVPAMAIMGLKLRSALEDQVTGLVAFPGLDDGVICSRGSFKDMRLAVELTDLLAFARWVPYPAGVKNAGIPAPPAQQRSASEPWGIRSTSSSPESIWRSNSSFSPRRS